MLCVNSSLAGQKPPPGAPGTSHLVAPRARAAAFPEFLRTHYPHYFSLDTRQETLERAKGRGLVLVYRWAVQTEKLTHFSDAQSNRVHIC